MARKLLHAQQKWIVLVIGFLLTGAIGYVDYLTGDYSILIFYLVPITLAVWFSGLWAGAALAACSGGARFVSDYSFAGTIRQLYWNSFADFLFLLVVAFLIFLLRTTLERENRSQG